MTIKPCPDHPEHHNRLCQLCVTYARSLMRPGEPLPIVMAESNTELNKNRIKGPRAEVRVTAYLCTMEQVREVNERVRTALAAPASQPVTDERNEAYYRGRDAGRMSERNKHDHRFDALQDISNMWRQRAKTAEGALNALRDVVSDLRERVAALGVAPKTEHYCSACAMVHRDGKCVAPMTDDPQAASPKAPSREQIAEAIFNTVHPAYARQYEHAEKSYREYALKIADAILSVFPAQGEPE